MMGVITYFGKYRSRLSNKTENLRNLLNEAPIFEWTQAHEREWQEIKAPLTAAPVLAFYDLATRVFTDASKYGLGAALFQLHGSQWRPVSYASRLLTETESRYSQIEKEALRSTYGCEIFYDFIYGKKVIVETDHKLLISISKKNLEDMPPRLQRFFICPMKYGYEFQYDPGIQLLLADKLSRAPTGRAVVDQNEDDNVVVHAVSVLSILVSKQRLTRLVSATQHGEELH